MDQRIETLRQRLRELAGDLWWSFHPEVNGLFRDVDAARWEALHHNPVALLAEIDDAQLVAVAAAHGLHARVDEARRARARYHARDVWQKAGAMRAAPVAYFSMEFGLHESMAIYSGGLGVLAGDHLKSASDLGIPMVAVGLFWREGYCVQRIDATGWQHDEFPVVPPSRQPLRRATDRNGRPVMVAIEAGDGTIRATVWELTVGRVRLYLLDADVDGNDDEDRALTARLYDSTERSRMRQELLLGVGGVRALRALGIRPSVVHLNEGHSAFATLELARERIELEGVDAAEAFRRVGRHVVFTTHTPVAAGHDRFEPGLLEETLAPLREALGVEPDELAALGRVRPDDPEEKFCMTVLALRLSCRANGVSAIHGGVSRAMWQPLWPTRTAEEVPIGHVTNGVHIGTWLAPAIRRVFDRHLRPDWPGYQADPSTWEAIELADDAELWAAHRVGKEALVDFVRRRESGDARRRGEPKEVADALEAALADDALLVGFGRRFAPYKRATLLLHDLDRLAALLDRPGRPVRLVYSGKAHPSDEEAKRMIQELFRVTRDERFLGKIVIVENYDMDVGRRLVQGVDVWLNTPRRPLEASGTSGQKVSINGGLNCSILDGWWAEAWDGENGFAIGRGETHVDRIVQDERDSTEVFSVLTNEVVPLFFDRDADGLPRGWIRRMKRAIRTCAWRFSADRMVLDYAHHCYLPAAGATTADVRG